MAQRPAPCPPTVLISRLSPACSNATRSSGDRLDVIQSIPLEAVDGGHRATYAELAEAATTTMVTDDVAVQLVSRDHLIRSKSAIDRPHDLAVVRQLTTGETG